MNKLQRLAAKLMKNIEQVIVGKEDVIRLILITLLCKGHMLLEDVPGMGKTMLVRTLAKSLGCSFKRIQFTPDLLPSDILGVSVYNQKTMDFEFRPGPIMAQMVLADEINRTSPRTQASLLECMEEEQITVDGITYELPKPFMILATQNPIEYEGTYPLPEAQLDRFLVRARLGYPTYEQEMEILERLEKKHPIAAIEQVFELEEIAELQKMVGEIYIEDSLKDYIVKIVQATREHPDVSLGASPRGSLALLKCSKAMAGTEGRNYVIPDDIKTLAVPTLAHRLVIKPEAHFKGYTQEDIVRDILNKIPVSL
ncbi:AAA family ATPase [Thermincola potens]|uniref:ATPase associated with various cellular activities AAA_3 n=1 Tax=Thermincola potens (strain JR) TaxID=635013 RepID=D5XCM4_THEPJ|nr:MoxR family ATPase [Thermincola potens]ADG81650.1 ATPase associated with various cellular activities AAA_3 [Thermincola potens JR]